MDVFELTIAEVVEETADALSISFEVPQAHVEEFTHSPGQFLTLAVPSELLGVAARCYSISSSPHSVAELAQVTITVKRTLGGYASNWLCDNLQPGHTMRALAPSGLFTPASLDAGLLLFAAGSGITPIMSIIRSALRQGRGQLQVFYANRDERSVIFGEELRMLAAVHPDRLTVVHWLETVQGLPTAAQVAAFATPFTSYDAFVCGPPPFMKMTFGMLKELGFPAQRRHQERFISLTGNPFGNPHDAEVAEIEIIAADSDVAAPGPLTDGLARTM